MSEIAIGAGVDANPLEVSFVVIAYNEAAHIAATIASIAGQEDLGHHEIVVVDDGSTDATAAEVECLAAANPRLRLLRHEGNAGRGAARATGVAAARAERVAMVDADILLPPHWWVTCRDALRDADAVGGTAVPDGDATYIHKITRLRPKVREATTTVTGNNGLYRATALRATGFDPSLADGEDIALNHALVAKGYRLRRIDGLLVEHQEDKDLRRSLAWLFQSGVGATRQLWRYRKVRTPDLAALGFVVVAVASGRGRHPRRFVAGVAGYLLAAATLHLSQRFELRSGRRGDAVRGILADALLLLAYFLGRVCGLTVLLSRCVG